MQPVAVLLIDFDKQYAVTTKQCLELQGGLTVENAFSTNEAIEKSKKLNPAVIVISIPPENIFFKRTIESIKQAGIHQPIIAFAIDVREQLRGCRIKVDGYVEKFGEPAAVYVQLKHSIIDLISAVDAEFLEDIVA